MLHVVPERLFHFSEDPTIARFVPHVPATNPGAGAHVWAIDADHAPLYWFPRDCPRVTVWATDPNEQIRLAERFDTAASRVHWMGSDWVERFDAVGLYVYDFDAAPFSPWTEADGQWIADVAVDPLGVQPLGSCRARHSDASIDLRTVEDLVAFVEPVVASGLPFSIVRMRR
jgi:hypothetical protein